MGNRCAIVLPHSKLYIYLHWNGGPESVYAFLDYAVKHCRTDETYFPARLCQVIGNYFGGTLSLGIGPVPVTSAGNGYADLDHGDNGVFAVHLAGEGYTVKRYTDGKRWDEARVELEAKRARTHKYWTDPDCPITKVIADRNDQHFIEKETAAA